MDTDYPAVFRTWVGHLLDHEGRTCATVPGDPGGTTAFGLSQRVWPDTVQRCPPELRALLPAKVADLTEEQAVAVYYHAFWLHIGADRMPAPLGGMVANIYVNGGQPIRWLQQALGVAADGVAGPATFAAIQAAHGRGAMVLAHLQALHLAYLASLPTWRTFGADDGRPKGWLTRATEELVQCVQLAKVAG